MDIKKLIYSIRGMTPTALDDVAARSVELYPEWKAGLDVKAGERYQCDSRLYKCIAPHTTQDCLLYTSKREQFSYMTTSLKRLAMSEGVAVLLAAQVNRNAQNSEPTMAQLKESGSIEEDSDNIILLHGIPLDQLEDTTGWNDNNRPVLVKIEKQRDGRTGAVRTAFKACLLYTSTRN